MRTLDFSKQLVLVAWLCVGTWSCGSSGGGGEGGGAGGSGGTGGSAVAGTGGGGVGAGGTNQAGAGSGTGGTTGSGGTLGGSGMGATAGGAPGGAGTGASAGLGGGGAGRGGGAGGAGTAGMAGKSSSAGTGGATGGSAGSSGDGCVVGPWPAADPTVAGPFTTVTENNVGPEAGAAEDDGTIPKFTLFRPDNLDQGGLCHPVITWGNGTGSTPNLYRNLLNQFASHGFVVIASNSTNVAQGDPKPMVVGVTWVLEQNEDPASELYHRLDPTHVGATGHSQGAVATSAASGDSHITTNVPIEGAQVQRNLHGPAMFFCGGMDTVVGCSGAQSALNAVTTLPALYAEYLSVDHGSWLGRGGKPSVVEATVTAWMRVHLMADDSLRPWFYGASCQLCSDSGWSIQQKNME